MNSPNVKRVFYNVHTVLDLGNYRLLVMQNLSQIDGSTIPEYLKLDVEEVGGDRQLYDKIHGKIMVLFSYYYISTC